MDRSVWHIVYDIANAITGSHANAKKDGEWKIAN
jgi:hypothetical protein